MTTPITLLKKLGHGAQSEVYLATLTINGQPREAAVKILKKQDSYERELTVLRRLPAHKNLVKLLDFVTSDKGVLLAFEYVHSSKDLRRYVPPDNTALLDLFYQIADGVSALHSTGILHRDIKLANIIIKGTTPYIIDFGEACEINKISGPTKCSGFVGTPNNMAPEVWYSKYSKASDVYALGVTFYMIVTKGKAPYTTSGEGQAALRDLKRQVTSREITPKHLTSDIPSLNLLVMRMIDKDDVARPPIGEVKEKLSEMIKMM